MKRLYWILIALVFFIALFILKDFLQVPFLSPTPGGCVDSDGGRSFYTKGTVSISEIVPKNLTPSGGLFSEQGGDLTNVEPETGGREIPQDAGSDGKDSSIKDNSNEETSPGKIALSPTLTRSDVDVKTPQPDVGNKPLPIEVLPTEGTPTTNKEDYLDYCEGKSVVEYFCSNGEVSFIRRSCRNGCEDGACIKGAEPYCDKIGTRSEGWYINRELIKLADCEDSSAECKTPGFDPQIGPTFRASPPTGEIECYANEHCDDGDPSTPDNICYFPGTIYSLCSQPITCFSDSDCSNNESIGSFLTCEGYNVINESYPHFICNNPGKLESYCSQTTKREFVQECGTNERCEEGACVLNTGGCYSLPAIPFGLCCPGLNGHGCTLPDSMGGSCCGDGSCRANGKFCCEEQGLFGVCNGDGINNPTDVCFLVEGGVASGCCLRDLLEQGAETCGTSCCAPEDFCAWGNASESLCCPDTDTQYSYCDEEKPFCCGAGVDPARTSYWDGQMHDADCCPWNAPNVFLKPDRKYDVCCPDGFTSSPDSSDCCPINQPSCGNMGACCAEGTECAYAGAGAYGALCCTPGVGACLYTLVCNPNDPDCSSFTREVCCDDSRCSDGSGTCEFIEQSDCSTCNENITGYATDCAPHADNAEGACCPESKSNYCAGALGTTCCAENAICDNGVCTFPPEGFSCNDYCQSLNSEYDYGFPESDLENPRFTCGKNLTIGSEFGNEFRCVNRIKEQSCLPQIRGLPGKGCDATIIEFFNFTESCNENTGKSEECCCVDQHAHQNYGLCLNIALDFSNENCDGCTEEGWGEEGWYDKKDDSLILKDSCTIENSCYDGIDNDLDGKIDGEDITCKDYGNRDIKMSPRGCERGSNGVIDSVSDKDILMSPGGCERGCEAAHDTVQSSGPVEGPHPPGSGSEPGSSPDWQVTCSNYINPPPTAGPFLHNIGFFDGAAGRVPANVRVVNRNRPIDADYYYETILTAFWKFTLNGQNLKILLPRTNAFIPFSTPGPMSTMEENSLPQSTTVTGQVHCKVFSFTYQRPLVLWYYELPFYLLENNICYYDVTYLLLDLILLGGNINGLVSACPELLNNQVTFPADPGCPNSYTCRVEVSPQGPYSIYLAFMDVDSYGDRIVSKGNDGQPFTSVEAARQVAQQWVDQCEQKYIICGDGEKEGNEECDDGNNIDGDGCSADCLKEACALIDTSSMETFTENSVLAQRLYSESDMLALGGFFSYARDQGLLQTQDPPALLTNTAANLMESYPWIAKLQARRRLLDNPAAEAKTCDCEQALVLARSYMHKALLKKNLNLINGNDRCGIAQEDFRKADEMYEWIQIKCVISDLPGFEGNRRIQSEVLTDLAVAYPDKPFDALKNMYRAIELDSSNQVARDVQAYYVSATLEMIRLRANDDITKLKMYHKEFIRPGETAWGRFKGFFLDGPHSFAWKNMQGYDGEFNGFWRRGNDANSAHEGIRMLQNYLSSGGDLNLVCDNVLADGINQNTGILILNAWNNNPTAGEIRSYNDLLFNQFSVEDAFHFASRTNNLIENSGFLFSPEYFFEPLSENPDIKNLCGLIRTGGAGVSRDFVFTTGGYHFEGLPNWYTPYHAIIGQAINPTNYFGGYAGAQIMGKVLPRVCRNFIGQSWGRAIVAETMGPAAVQLSTAGLPAPYNWIGELSSTLVSFGPAGQVAKQAAALNFDSEYRKLLMFHESDMSVIDAIMTDSRLVIDKTQFSSSQAFVDRLNELYPALRTPVVKEEFETAVKKSVGEFIDGQKPKCEKPLEGVELGNRQIFPCKACWLRCTGQPSCGDLPGTLRTIQARNLDLQTVDVQVINNLDTREAVEQIFTTDLGGGVRGAKVIVNPETGGIWIWSSQTDVHHIGITEAAYAEVNGLDLNDINLLEEQWQRTIIPDYFGYQLQLHPDGTITGYRSASIEDARNALDIPTVDETFWEAHSMLYDKMLGGTNLMGGTGVVNLDPVLGTYVHFIKREP